ncbi:MAG TPA: glycosyl hydrolase, partial [Micromonosporaceae bacterium]|nr:glycosyl hydrolase [Micromonosporaceae bacterium]
GVSGMGAKPTPKPTATPTAPAGGFRPFPAPRKTLPGAALHLKGGESFGDALRRSDRTYGPLRMVRVFYPGLPPSWSGSRADVANRTVVVSFKAHPREVNAGRHDAKLTSWFASVPRNVDVYWAYYHEPENDVESGSYTPAQFASAFRRVSGLADKARNPRLRATLILMCWTLNPNSRRDFNDYYPGADAVDVLGWDWYNRGTKNNRYTPPGDVFSRMISKSRALGKPWGLAETGSAKIRSDSSGTGRAAWLRSMSQYLNEQKPLWVAYYDYQVSGGDFRLLDAPSQAAWKAWCAAAPA